MKILSKNVSFRKCKIFYFKMSGWHSKTWMWMWQKMGSLIDRYYSRLLGISRQKNSETLRLWRSIWNRSEPWISALHLYPSTPRSSSDNFSLTLHFTKRVRNLTLLILGASSLIFIFPPKQNLIDFSPPGSHYLLNITVGIPDMMIKLGWLLN